jgi:hypothetical protein
MSRLAMAKARLILPRIAGEGNRAKRGGGVTAADCAG